MKARSDPDFPSDTVFRRVGRKSELALKVIQYCRQSINDQDVVRICKPLSAHPTEDRQDDTIDNCEFGFVYLIKHGRDYRIGRTNSVGRREYEHGIRLPEKPKLIHKIKTDDPQGIELYWLRRFEPKRKRKGADWFELSPEDVSAFKRREFM
jgi:hypothetical protein